MHNVQIHNLTHLLPTPISASYCKSFWSRFRGLMLHDPLRENEGALLVENADSRMDSAIHMLFMNFDITAVWINAQNEVVDVKLARKWRPAYIPQKPARYILEAHTSQILQFHIGDRIEFKNV
jgi:uncharacterized membrane protein (UPF0127 family)